MTIGICYEESSLNNDGDVAKIELDRLRIGLETSPSSGSSHIINNNNEANEDSGVQITCFSEVFDAVTLHFQVICLPKQIYAWIGCNSTNFGHLYAAANARPENNVRVTSLLGGTSDNPGSGIAGRLVLKTGWNVILACNIPKNSPMIELLSFSLTHTRTWSLFFSILRISGRCGTKAGTEANQSWVH